MTARVVRVLAEACCVCNALATCRFKVRSGAGAAHARYACEEPTHRDAALEQIRNEARIDAFTDRASVVVSTCRQGFSLATGRSLDDARR